MASPSNPPVTSSAARSFRLHPQRFLAFFAVKSALPFAPLPFVHGRQTARKNLAPDDIALVKLIVPATGVLVEKSVQFFESKLVEVWIT